MSEKFGEQGREDATASWEIIIDEVTTEAIDRFRSIAPTVLNRGIDTHPIPVKDQVQDYLALLQDPKTLKQQYEALAADPSTGPDMAELQVLRMEDRARKELGDA